MAVSVAVATALRMSAARNATETPMHRPSRSVVDMSAKLPCVMWCDTKRMGTTVGRVAMKLPERLSQRVMGTGSVAPVNTTDSRTIVL